jgi:flagellar L-ring protein precursor FlgH
MTKLFSSLYNTTTLAVFLLTVHFGVLASDTFWKDSKTPSMFADKKAHTTGDLLTIIVDENNGASRQNNTTTSKKASVDASIASFLYGPGASSFLLRGGQYPAMKYASQADFTGGGQIQNQETITARISVTVVDSLPNGNLVVEGRRQTAFGGEKQEAVLRGTVRADDVAANNTVFSYNVADASIQFIGKGAISDNQRRGWFTRIWDFLSPF